jgi:hypothetical protein
MMSPLYARQPDDSDGDKGPTLIVVSSALTTIAFITTVLRLWVRRARRALGSDDYAIAAAMVLTIIEAALTIQAVTHGKGKRTVYLDRNEINYISMFSWLAQIFLFPAMALVKVSVCLLMTRLHGSKKLRCVTRSIITLLLLAALEVVIVLLAQCRPISASWQPLSGACWRTDVRLYSIYAQVGEPTWVMGKFLILTDQKLSPLQLISAVRSCQSQSCGTWICRSQGKHRSAP